MSIIEICRELERRLDNVFISSAEKERIKLLIRNLQKREEVNKSKAA